MNINPQKNINAENYLKWTETLEGFGICTDTIPRSLLETRLRMRMNALGFRSFYHYHDYLKSLGKNNLEWKVLVNHLTVQKTQFFRHSESLSLIENFLYSNQRPLPGKTPPTIHTWSVACATGEEAYSLAIVINKTLQGTTNNVFFGITATDISHSALNCSHPALERINHEDTLAYRRKADL